MTTPNVSPVSAEELDANFEEWWEKEGQFCQSGGGAYEKTFAYRAYVAAWNKRSTAASGGKVAEDDNDLCELAEKFGAIVAWANEPDEFHHIIEITPRELRSMLEAAPVAQAEQPQAAQSDVCPPDSGKSEEQANLSVEGERQKFEQHMLSCPKIASRWGKPQTYQMDGEYFEGIMFAAWSAWQASALLSRADGNEGGGK